MMDTDKCKCGEHKYKNDDLCLSCKSLILAGRLDPIKKARLDGIKKWMNLARKNKQWRQHRILMRAYILELNQSPSILPSGTSL